MPVAEPHKELRFTRAAQGVGFWIFSGMAGMAAITLLVASFYRDVNPQLPHPLWATVPLLVAAGAVRVALHCTRRAYVILSPIGVEIFPFLRPSQNMQVIPWPQIHDVETSGTTLTLHFDAGHTSGIHLSLSPIPKPRRPLLVRALQGRCASKGS